MKNRFITIGTAVILMAGVCTMSPLTGQEQILDENGYMDMPAGGEQIPTEYFESRNQVQPDSFDPGQDPATPVDGGLGFLLAAGLGYGANRLRKKREQKRTFDK